MNCCWNHLQEAEARLPKLDAGQIAQLAFTEWLQGSLALDAKGFIKAGTDVREGWPLLRDPHPLETSLPGVFAIGDIRTESVKRVASAVGEGSMVVQFVHKVLAE